jgi:hypothetical protein
MPLFGGDEGADGAPAFLPPSALTTTRSWITVAHAILSACRLLVSGQ